jgi:hypothetical protein
MSFAITSPSDIVNLALVRIGYKKRVGSLYDGSKAASLALDIYAQTRDDLLRDGDWPFAERNGSLTLLKSAPALPGGGHGYIPPIVWTSAYPPLPWLFEYDWPADCLKVRAVKPVSLFVPNFDPQPHLFSIANDNANSPAKRVILSNVESPICTYTGQVTDPSTWPQDFIEALAAALGRRLAPGLVGGNTAQMEAADEQASKAEAEAQQG